MLRPSKQAKSIATSALRRNNVRVSNVEFEQIAYHVYAFFMDKENYPNSKNLRVARRFNSNELDGYIKQAEYTFKDSPTLFETTVHSKEGSFYFGFNYR